MTGTFVKDLRQGPAWAYAKDDPRAFSKWQRKMSVWRIQVANYLPPEEAAMYLYTSLKGEAEEELEWVDLEKIHHPNGIDFIIEALRKPLQTREVYLKRRYLFEYEGIQRQNGESIRSFCNRYHRCERTLSAVGIDVTTMYDLESRGARLLDRLRLNLDQQRMILIGSSQSIEFDAIREAAILQFPDHRPTPFVAREFDWNRGNDRQRREDQGAPSASTGRGAGGSNKGRGKGGKDGSGKGKSNFTPRNAYVAEQPNDLEDGSQKDDNAELEVIDENYETAGEEVDEETYAGGEQQEDDDGEIDGTEHDLDIAAHCLTVTARRLAGMKLGRKFSGGNKSLAQRKQESHCAACGERGHWKGDPECPVSGTSTSSPPASSSAKGAKPKGEKGAGKGDKKKVLTVTRPGGKQLIPIEEECPTDETYGNHFVYMVKTPTFEVASFQVFRCNLKDLSKYLVLDTACQRTCCSTKWFQHWEETVAPLRLKAKKTPNQEPFEFGHGETQYSSIHAYLPTCFNYDESAMCLLGTCVIDATNDIPLLGSNTLLVKLQAIIDLPKKEIQLQALGCAVPLLTVNNHLAVDMTCFPEQVRKSSQWNSLSQMSDSHNADPELLMNEVPPEQHRGSSVVLSNSTFPSVSNAGATTMDPKMALLCDDLHGGGKDAHPQLGPGSEVGTTQQSMAESPRPAVHGGTDSIVGEVHRTMHPRPAEEVRQQTWPVQQLHELRKEVGMERKPAAVGRLSSTKRAIAAAFTVLIHSCSVPGSSLHTREAVGNASTPSFTVESHQPGEFSTWQDSNDVYYNSQEPNQNQVGRQASQVQVESFSTKERSRCGDSNVRSERGVRMGSGGSMKPGQKTWLAGHLKTTRKIYEKENAIYKNLASHQDYKRDGCLVDVMEVFANRARVSELAPRFGLSAVQPIDKVYDFDLYTKDGIQTLWSAIQRLRPLLIIIAWPCTEWSLFNQNMNYSYRLEVLEEKRQEQRPLVNLGADICEYQRSQGRLYLGENPMNSALWREPSVVKVTDHPDNYETWCHAGAYGAESSEGFPIQKSHKWITNSKLIADQLGARLTDEQKAYCKPIEGKETKSSGEYCHGLACAILEGLQAESRRRCPQRFHPVPGHNVYYAKPLDDAEVWNGILDEIEARFQKTQKRPFDISAADDLYQEICKLVPWEMSKVQAAWCPLVRRFPSELPFTHRGAALRTNDGELLIESEDLVAVTYPKQRFTKPIRCAVFFYGNAPDEQVIDADEKELPDAATADSGRLPGFNTDIRFVNGPPMTKEMRTSIARLHCNLGHPPKAEIVRILAAAGKLDSKILAALDALQCGSCLRLSKATKPPASSTSTVTKYSGCFGDYIQADIIYIRLLDGKAYPVLGLICMSTNYHAAKAIENRTPEHVLEVMKEIWYRPFGLPVSVQVDPDGCFLGPNQDWHQSLGIEVNVIPGEEAWRLGKIGRRNALMRTLAERLIDQNGAYTKKHLDDILVAVLNSMNTSTYTYGRSPCQAVFGRIPRPVGDIVSDQHALTISPQANEEQGALRHELLRAEALSALAQFSASQAVKRALLRKTRNQKDPNQLQPGQAVAYWRMSGKTRQHKRGAWNLARFLAWDPDQKSACFRSENIQCESEQHRLDQQVDGKVGHPVRRTSS